MQTEVATETVRESGNAETSAEPLTAGETLSQARQRLGLNEKEVADQLHITMHYVKALESDSYEKLPGAVFAKGYIKSYALLLGLDAEQLLLRYEGFTNKQRAESIEANRITAARRKKDRNKPLVAVSLVIFVGGFLGLWLANSLFGEQDPAQLSSSTETENVAEPLRSAAAALPAAIDSQPRLSVQAREELPATIRDAADVKAEAEAPEQADSENTVLAGNLTTQPLPVEESPVVSTLQDVAAVLATGGLPQPSERDASPAPTSEAEQPRVISVDSIGNDVLRISFSGESWVEVNDSESQQIYRDIREAGDVLEITGSAPFNILLGDAPFTHLSLNGAEIDLSSDIRIDNSARLTVGL